VPTYVYRSEDGHKFEVEQKITEEPYESATIASTGQVVLVKRVPQIVQATYKGSGWARG
jgi:predicted nucleic acid-binding Zn ribbon protein